MGFKEELELIKKGVSEIIEESELIEKLNKKKVLRVKAGFDPTSKDLHLGHVILLQKLRTFQILGHEVYFIVGDFTATIGDPSGRNETRPPLSQEEVKENAKTYTEQAFKVLIKEKTKILYNSSWLSELGAKDMVELCGKYTVARMLERDDFSKRFKNGIPIYIHEFLYPLLQGYDSVKIEADVELGGTDQKFNLLVGRELQKEYNQEKQICITLPLLVGLDGVKKMSKSYNNYIALKDSPEDMFGKVMSISDEMMYDYYLLLTDKTPKEIEEIKKKHPKEAKMELAHLLVERFHSKEDADRALRNFELTFSKKEFPEDAPIFTFKEGTIFKAFEIPVKLGFTNSNNESRRVIYQGGLKINEKKVENPNEEIYLDKELRIAFGKKRFGIIKPKKE